MSARVRRRIAGRHRPAIAILAVALLGLAAQPAAAEARPLVTGIAGIGDYRPAVFEQARSSGARLVRLALYWEKVAPGHRPASWQPENPADPHYDWGYIDQGVTEAVRAGLTPVLLVDGAPRWAQRCTAPAGLQLGDLCDPDPAALESFAKAAASRYSGHFGGLPHVRYWQGLNEPNLSIFFFPQFAAGGKVVSPYLYRQLINAFHAGIKSIDRSNLVLAAGLGPIAVRKLTVGPMRFARKLLCMRGRHRPRPARGNCEGGVHFDIFVVHPYTTGGPFHQGRVDDVQLGDLGKLQRLLRAADRAGRIEGRFRRTPLWAMEFSWDSKPPDPGGLAMRILSRWTAEALHRAWRAGVSRFFWYSLRDDPYNPKLPFSETLQSGLYFRGANVVDDRPKKVFYAFRFPFVAYPLKRRGLYFWGRTASSAGGSVAIEVWRGGRWRRAAVAKADGRGIFRGTVRRRYGGNRRGLARAVYGDEASVPFSMRPVKDFRQPPFGAPVG